MDVLQEENRSPVNVFYSYANEDEELREKLETHLSLLQQQGLIAGWHHHKILPGPHRSQVHDEHFSSAQIILLLISPDFLASDIAYAEMQQALQLHKAGRTRVIPLLLRPVDLEHVPFAHLQVLPHNGEPVTTWRNPDLAFVDIAKGIRAVLEHLVLPQSASHLPTHTPLGVSAFPCVFLSYAQKDLSLAKRLKDDLHSHGIIGWVDHQTAESGSLDEDEDLREAIRQTSAVVLVASPRTRRSRLVKHELEIAEMYQRPVSLFWMQGNHLAEVVPAGWNGFPVFDAREEHYPQALQELLQGLSRQASSSSQALVGERLVPPLQAPRNPYKGLRAFGGEDAQDFFGRDRLIEEILEQIELRLAASQQAESASRLLTILGPSGSGKSSVVMAGVIPTLKKGVLSGRKHWIFLDPMVPGPHPIEALTLTLASLFPERSLKSIREDLEEDLARGLHLLLTTQVKQSGIRVLLVIDQFEELFTQTVIENERRRFLDLLFVAVTEPHGPLIVLITLRADFYDRPLHYPELGHLIKSHQVIVFPMETRDLRAVIEQPAQLPDVQLTFEEDLVGDLLFDVQGQVGALPLLQFTLDQLFQQREGRLLTAHAYEKIGKVKGALAQHAERTYQSLPTPAHQRLARALFLRLINPGMVEQDATKRRVPLSELTVIDSEETALLADVRMIFTGARLLTINAVRGVSTVEVSHEALIGAWPRLEDWLHEARDDMRLQQAISEDAAEWKHHGQPADRLYRGSQLTRALAWRKANVPSPDEDAFLQASVEELRRGQRRFTRRAVLIGLAGVVGMVGTGFVVKAFFGNTPLLSQTGLPYTGHTDAVTSIAWSPDGKRLASASADKTVQVWDASTGNRLLTYTGHIGSVYTIAWSPDGTRLASASFDETVQVWDASTGNHLLTYTGHTDTVWSTAWSPDGKRLASASDDRTVQVWDASTGTSLLTYTGHTDAVKSTAWSPDGKRLASASADKTVQVWDASTGNRLLTYTGHIGSVYTIAWSPDGTRLASASFDTTAQVWDASTGNSLLIYRGHTAPVTSIAWSPDGTRLSSASDDRTAQVWDATTLLTYRKHTASVWSTAWSPDGKRLASASDDRTVQVWDAITGTPLLIYRGHTASVWSTAWSPDGKRLVSASDDRTAQIWDASTGNRLLIYRGHTAPVWSTAWSPDGTRLASASADATVQVWDASNGTPLLTYTGHTAPVKSIAWSPDGKRLASASIDKTVQVWDASTGNPLLTYTGHTAPVWSTTWSPNGKRLASASNDRTVQVWDASTGNRLLIYTGHTAPVWSTAWSPDGKRLASASADRTVQVWDASTGNHLLTYRKHTAPVWSTAWSPDGKRLASASVDATVQVWWTL